MAGAGMGGGGGMGGMQERVNAEGSTSNAEFQHSLQHSEFTIQHWSGRAGEIPAGLFASTVRPPRNR